MKNKNLLNWLWTESYEKQSPQRFARYAAMLIMLLTLGVGQMWADSSVTGASIKYDVNSSSNQWWNVSGTAKQLGQVSTFKLKGFWAQLGTENVCQNTCMYYGLTSACSLGNYNIENPNSWDPTTKHFQTESMNVNILSGLTPNKYTLYAKFIGHGQKSGNSCGDISSSTYQMKFEYPAYLTGDGTWCGTEWNTTNDAQKMTYGTDYYSKTISSVTKADHKLKVATYNWASSWGHAKYDASNSSNVYSEVNDDGNIKFQPAMAGNVTIKFNISDQKISIICAAPTITFDDEGGSGGDGTLNTYYGTAPTNVTVPTKLGGYSFAGYWTGDDGTGTQVIGANGAWLRNVTNFTNNDDTWKWIVRNNYTLHAKWTQDPTLTMNSVSPTTLVEGNSVTINVTRANSSAVISYEYKIGSGSWTSLTPTSTSNSGQTATWTTPEAHGATRTFYFRAMMTDGSLITTAASDAVTVYGKKTIHVRNTNDWATFKMHHWGDANPTTMPGNADNISSYGGQWKDVVILSSYTGFVLNNGAASGGHQSYDLFYNTYSDGDYYAFATNSTYTGGAYKHALSSSSAPAAPTATTNDANEITSTTAKFNYSVSANRDKTTPGIAFVQSDDDVDATTIYSGGTKVSGSAILDGNTSGATAAQTITPGKKYYYVAYGTNGFGTGYGVVKSFVAPYKVTVSTNTGCAEITNSGINYTNSTITVTATAATGYEFSSWSTTNGTQTSTSSEGNTNTLVFTPTAENATIQPVYTPIVYDITLDDQDATSEYHKIALTIKYNGTYFEDDDDQLYPTPESPDLPYKSGYHFQGWYTGIGGAGLQIMDAGGQLQSNKASYSDSEGKWIHTENITLYAKWLQSSEYGYLDILLNNNGGAGGQVVAIYNSNTLASFTASTRTGYIFQGYFTAAEGGNKIINVDGSIVAGNVTGFVTDGKWTNSSLSAEIYAQWTPITYTIAFAKNNDASYYGSETGDNPTPIAATYDVNATMPENTYSRTGYHFIGWSTEAHKAKGSCPGVDYDYAAGGTARNLSSTQGATVTLYPKWLGNTHTISFNARGGYVSQTSSNITFDETYGSGTGLYGNLPIPTPPSGYEFSGWYTASEGGTEVTKDDKMHTDGDHTLYAHYVRKDRVYFKNTLGWENVYVTWDAEWNHGGSDKGAGASGKTQELMNHIYGTDIWYKDIPAAILSDWAYNIAFTSKAMDNYEWFDDGEAVFRRDFDKKATMFVPVPNDPNKFLKNKHDSKPGTLYYSTNQAEGDPQGRYKNGYWVKYNDLQAGYDLKGSWNWVEHHYIERPNPEDSVYIFTIQGLSANTTYQFKLYKDVEVNNTGSEFSSTTSITSATAPDAAIFNAADGGSNASMKTTVAGDYTFKFNFSALGEVKLTVDYPFAVNDYKVVYSYTKDGAKTFESQYIKARANGIDTISMFIHSGDCATSRSLAIHKCTAINASGVATWNTSYASIALPAETASGKTSGVYNIQISQNESSAATGECVGRYEGQYYIRSQAADGGWDQYKVHADNLMTLSEYSLKQTLSAPYSHYFCKYIDNSTTEVTFTIATDYSPSICPVMVGDETIGGLANKTLPEGKSASVRFMWNEETNATGRSYLKSAQGPRNVRFLVLHGAEDNMIFNNDATGTAIPASGDLAKNEKIFEDTENWVYECYIKAKPGAKVSLIAKYNELDRYLIGGPSSWETIIGGTGGSKYIMKVVYDFKTNRLMTAWVPSEEITEKLSNIDVIIERHNQDGATTITFKRATEESEAGSIEAKSVIGALRFDYDELVGRVASWTPDTRAKMMFLVSFPFDVNISDIFGLNTNYGEAFIVQQYNGAKRAEKGFFQLDGTDTFWETLPVDSVMHAGVGYCVCMDNDYLNNDVGHLWDNKKAGSSIYLYFPSANGDIVINSDAKTIHVPAHECKINRTFNGGKLNHKYTDSNWNMMGIPIFQNHTGDKDAAGTPGAIFTPDKDPSDTTDYKPGIGFFYKWSTDKSYSVQKAQGYVFKPMHGYLVQYAGDVTFTCAAPVVASVAARRIPLEEDYELELQVLNTSEEVLNRTYVELREEACDTFALNEDLYLAMNKHDVNVYTFAGTYNVAANVLSVDNHIVPMGVVVRKEGTYTFSMPDNFSGEVILVDKSAQTRTNLAMTDYEIHLPAGTIDDRFELEINIHKVPTVIDGAKAGEGTLKDGKVHKFIMNDQMYILKDGVLYDARGNRVK